MNSQSHTYGQTESKQIATVQLSKEQQEAIAQATGVDVTQLDVCEVTGDAARNIAPLLLKGVFVVCCW
jgi:hypothetical protein